MEDKEFKAPKGCASCVYQKCQLLNFPCSECNVLFGFSKEYYPKDKDYYKRRE